MSHAVSELDRREFLQLSAGATAASLFGRLRASQAQATDGWNQGQLVHLIPSQTTNGS